MTRNKRKLPIAAVRLVSFFFTIASYFSITIFSSCEKDEDPKVPKFLVHNSEPESFIVAGDNNMQTISVRVLDSDSVPMAGVKVYFTVSEGHGVIADSIATSDANGIATAQMTPDTKRGSVVVKVQAEELLDLPIFFLFQIVSGSPAKIEVQSGNNQEVRENTRLPNSLFFLVTDKFGNPVANVPVAFSIKSGKGTLSASSGTTATNGIAVVEFTTGKGTLLTYISASAGNSLYSEAMVYALLPVQTDAPRSDDKNVTISWSKSTSPNFQKYSLYRSRSGFNDWSVLTEISNVTSFEDNNTSIGFRYAYYVRVNTKPGDQIDSNQETAEVGKLMTLTNNAEYLRFCLDNRNGIFYMPGYYENKIILVSANTLQKIDSITLTYVPRDLALSRDFTKLYVAKYQSFDVVDIATKSVVRTVDLSATKIGGLTHIYTTTDGQLFASGDYIFEIDEGNDYALQKVAGGRSFFDDQVTFLGDDGHYLYAEVSNHTPNDLFKLDLSQASVPLILEDRHGSVYATDEAHLSPDGSKLYMGEGQIIRTTDFTTAGDLPDVVYAVAVSGNGDKIFTSTPVRYATGSLNTVNATTLAVEKQMEVGFTAKRMLYYDNALFVIAELGFSSDAWRFFRINMD